MLLAVGLRLLEANRSRKSWARDSPLPKARRGPLCGGIKRRRPAKAFLDMKLSYGSFAQKIHGVREKADRHSRAGGNPRTSIAYLAHRLTIPPGLIARFPPARE
jgi:hypothetical protein